MTVHVRAAAPADLDILEAIENAADRLLIDRLQPEAWTPAPSGAHRTSEPGFILVADVAPGTVVGFVHVLDTAACAHVEQLSVLPDYGRRGIGRALLDAAMEHARRRGHTRMTLRTYADVPWNGPFYAHAGFVEEEPRTAFERELARTDARLGLERHGRRIQMGALLR